MPLPAQPRTDRLDQARQVVRAEAAALELVAHRLDDAFDRAIDLLLSMTGSGPGRVALTGTGKSADVAQKMAGTFNSTGTRSYVLDATRAVHGDLGMIHPEDVAVVLSHSGESEEIVRLLPSLRTLVRAVIGLTGSASGTLARKADVAVVYGPLDEACPLGLAPSASTAAMNAVGDALAFVLSTERGFLAEDFARFHPAAAWERSCCVSNRSCGPAPTSASLMPPTPCGPSSLRAVMSAGGPVPSCSSTPTDAYAACSPDSDLARLIEARRDEALDRPIAEVMTRKPLTAGVGDRVMAALEILRRRKISELPVIDSDGRPVGLLDITDLLAVAAAPDEQGNGRGWPTPLRVGA